MQLHLHPHACSRGGSRCRRRLTWQEQRARCCSNVAVKCCFALVVPTQPSLEACTSVAILFTTDSNAGCRDGWLRPALVSLRPPDEGERHQQEKHDAHFVSLCLQGVLRPLPRLQQCPWFETNRHLLHECLHHLFMILRAVKILVCPRLKL
ncbi:uncharacterized protein [Triticum aestivum]|uniref:uncharacterized protein isoform X1 n=1 Tax=Triticum aestivum TaxID=4565 RepID=UPI001D018A8B|nr:uncharacterized protein LOC123091494 isoform X1 [Triticum aestivum]